MKREIKTVFERSIPGARCVTMPKAPPDTPMDEKLARKSPLKLPEVAESTLMRHYTVLKNNTFGVDTGFYPLGSCTMKYNPKINEKLASLESFADIHPLAAEEDAQGWLKLLYTLQQQLCAVTGMDAFTLSPSAGSQGEWTGLDIIRAYHASKGDFKRIRALIPDSAHGTNPANAAIAGFKIVNLPSRDGLVDLDVLGSNLNQETAVLMMTNPNTLGLFEKDVLKISKMCHDAGALLYYDGANLNAVMGISRPADMGFDVMHVNLHKTFSAPHGGGGPGCGPVGCKAYLKDFLPLTIAEKNGYYRPVQPPQSIGRVSAYFGNALVALKAFAYITALGGGGLAEASRRAVVNANYLKAKIAPLFKADLPPCMHEFVLSLGNLKEDTGVTALDFAKALIDRGMHPPTVYFPLIVREALMIEPTETETKDTLDAAAEAFREICERASLDPASVKASPETTPVSRPDEVSAARNPRLTFEW